MWRALRNSFVLVREKRVRILIASVSRLSSPSINVLLSTGVEGHLVLGC